MSVAYHSDLSQQAFGRRGGGGRRADGRTPIALYAVLKTMLASRSADVSDISATGVKLRGRDLPRRGQDLFIRIEGVEVFATVIWCDADECGAAFETPLSHDELDALQREARRTRLMQLTPEQKQAWDQWAGSRR